VGWLLLLAVLAVSRSSAVQEAVRRLAVSLRGKLVQLELWAIGGGFYLRADAASAFASMRAQALSEGVALQVNSAWRTREQQKALYDDYVSGRRSAVAAPPGYSNHEGGTAVDVETAWGTNAAYLWLSANAHRFGFSRTVPDEPWHWEYTA